MNTSTLTELIESSRFDICHAECKFDPFRHIYAAKAGNKKVKLLKILLSNDCSFDCNYCPNGWKKGVSITPEELSKVFFYLRGQGAINGAFISSAVNGDPEKVMEKIIKAGELIRRGFEGYIHLKVMPGASREQIKRALEVANRVSINVESTSQSRISELSSVKDLKNDIMRRERWIHKEVEKFKKRGQKRSHTTQLIVGVGETDYEIIESMETHYREFGIARLYYSPFTPIKGTPMEKRRKERGERVVNLYRADALIRIYGFESKQIKEILVNGTLPDKDPKTLIAENMEKSGKLELIHIPGVGRKKAELLEKGYSFAELKRMGFSIKRAAPYIPSQTKLNLFE